MRTGESGYTLVEMAIGAALSGVVIIGILSFMGIFSKMSLDTRASVTRDELLLRLRQNISKQKVLDKNATLNPDFNACMNKSAFLCEHALEYDLDLYDLDGTQLSAGAEKGPYYYDISGQPCGLTKTRPTCVITVSSVFRPYCRSFERDGSGHCAQAEYIEIYFTVGSEQDPRTGKNYFPDSNGVLYFNQEDRA